ncbi:MAG: type II secretion system protein GspL [Pseudomonadota bacterium]|nr:hypothetical protein [Gammaproteobacteria bacterium]MEE2683901.1 type II secretion system protein GspL [Pseudomonadota bacterium]|tara:strand:- start:936 stop:2174 length:1239 start_codon:yes stop_codon:yes gene_type:complete
MSEYFVIRLINDKFYSSWIKIDKKGHYTQEAKFGNLSDAANDLEGKPKIIILIPGSKVSINIAALPTRNNNNIIKMLPFLIEENTADDTNNLFFTHKFLGKGNDAVIASISKNYLNRIILKLNELNIYPTYIYSDSQGITDIPGHLTLIAEKDFTYGKIPGEQPFVIENLKLIDIWNMIPKKYKSEDLINNIILYTDESGFNRCKDEINELREKVKSVNFLKFKKGLLPGLASSLIKNPGNNFLTGEFMPETNWIELLRPWKIPISLTLLLFITNIFGNFIEMNRLKFENIGLVNQINNQCVEIFNSPNISTCETMINQQLSTTSSRLDSIGESLFLEIINAISFHIDQNISLESIIYRDNTMNLRVTTSDIATLDAFTTSIQGYERLSITIQSTNQIDNGIEGRLQIMELL